MRLQLGTFNYQIKWRYNSHTHEISIFYYPLLPLEDAWRKEFRDSFSLIVETGKYEDYGKMLEVIHNECFSYASEESKDLGNGRSISPIIKPDIINHYVSNSFPGVSPDPGIVLNELIDLHYKVEILGKTLTKGKGIKSLQLSEVNRRNLKKIDNWIKFESHKHFMSYLSDADKENFKEHLPQRKKVFLSLRGRCKPFAETIHDYLTDYANATFFEPYIFSRDISPGKWMEQFRKKIQEFECYVPLLSHDFFDGPIAMKEFKIADERYSEKKDLVIVGLVVEGEYDDYPQMNDYSNVRFPLNISEDQIQDKIDELAVLLMKAPE